MPEREISVRAKQSVLCCTHCGRHPATAYIFRYAEDLNELKSKQVDLCSACAMRIEKLMQPIVHRPRAAKPVAAPKPKRGRPRKIRPADDEARIKTENDALLGR